MRLSMVRCSECAEGYVRHDVYGYGEAGSTKGEDPMRDRRLHIVLS